MLSYFSSLGRLRHNLSCFCLKGKYPNFLRAFSRNSSCPFTFHFWNLILALSLTWLWTSVIASWRTLYLGTNLDLSKSDLFFFSTLILCFKICTIWYFMFCSDWGYKPVLRSTKLASLRSDQISSLTPLIALQIAAKVGFFGTF